MSGVEGHEDRERGDMAATDLHIRQITHFLAIVEEGSFGKAAQRVHLSQPALSKSIRQLEERLQVRLIDRTPQGVTPTGFGTAFMEHARAIRTEIGQAVAQLREMQGLRIGSVSVGVGPSVASGILPYVMTRIASDHPEITVNVTEGLSDTLARGLLCGELDFVIGARLDFDNGAEINHEPLYVDRCAIVARAGHPIMAAAPPSLADLVGQRWILTRRPEALRTRFDDIFRRRELEPPVPAAQTNSISFMRDAIAETDMLSFLPRIMILRDQAEGRLAILDHPDCFWERSIFFSHRRRRTLSPLSRLFAATVRAVIADMEV
jgi:DNA-binding transcriptional LysR family regulator